MTCLSTQIPTATPLTDYRILFGFGSLIYINYIYQVYIIGDFAAYPEPVAAKLRRALYYTNIDLQPKNAIKYYRQALALADEIGMDPFSDEILGVKIQLSALFEKLHAYQQAIDVLEIVRGDCLKWMEVLGGLERNRGKRTRVLGKTIGISVRLGEFYANDYIQDQDAAEERLVWAVTALLKEQRRREEDGVKEGEGDWMSNEEIGAALECRMPLRTDSNKLIDGMIALGSHYETKQQHYLAAPLFLQALGLCPSQSCHSVVLSKLPQTSSDFPMVNAICSEQPRHLLSPTASPSEPHTKPSPHIPCLAPLRRPSMGTQGPGASSFNETS